MTNLLSNTDIQALVFPPDRGIGVLAVPPPYPVGHKLQNDGASGVNINMVYGDRDGLLVYILAYLGMAVGDYIKVYLDSRNAPVAEFFVTDAHFDGPEPKNIPFYISAKDMEARFSPLLSANKNLWFWVRRISENTEESPPVSLFYKYPAPGEVDTDGGKPFNQGLKLPVASESFVDQTVINDGMFVTVVEYFNQSIGDRVVLVFGSRKLEVIVSALGDVIFELTPELLATLTSTNSLVVRWEVFDAVENSSGWSDALILPFKPGIVLLAAPIFEQADPDNVLHHDLLLGGPTNVLVIGIFALNDRIELTLTGFTKGGEPVSHTYSQTLNAASRTVNFPIENEKLRNLIGGSLRASYQLIKASGTQLSKPADITISGTSLSLGLPIVEPLVDNKLPVDTVMASVRVADYWPLKAGATVEARWQTSDPDGIAALFIFRLIVTDPTQPVIFKVPAKYIAPYTSSPLTVQCVITNVGESPVYSQLLQLMIGGETQIVLKPAFPVAAVSPIDVLAYPNGVTMRIEYLDALDGDRARLVEVNPPTGTPQFPLVAFNINKRVNTVLSPAFLAARQGKDIGLRWNLNRGGVLVGKSPVMTLSVLKIVEGDIRLPIPTIAGVSDNGLDVNKLQASDLLQVSQWPLQAVGQPVSLSYAGIDDNDNPVVYEDRKGEPNTQMPGFTSPVPLSWLKTLKNNSVLKVFFKVNFDGVPDSASATGFPVRSYTVSVLAEDMTLKITSVKGSPSNTEITDGASTAEKSFVFRGKAAPGQQIELRDKGVVVGNPIPVDTAHDWTHTLTNQATGDHSYTAKALYGSGAETVARTLRITAGFALAITSVKDSFNQHIQQHGGAVTAVKSVSGKAPVGTEIVLRDRGSFLGSTKTTLQETWSVPTSSTGSLDLRQGPYHFVVYDKNDSGATSAEYLVSVETRVTPQITRVEDQDGNLITSESTTTKRTFIVRGIATPKQTIYPRYGYSPSGEVIGLVSAQADAQGNWHCTFFSLRTGPCWLSVYDNLGGVYSSQWRVHIQ